MGMRDKELPLLPRTVFHSVAVPPGVAADGRTAATSEELKRVVFHPTTLPPRESPADRAARRKLLLDLSKEIICLDSHSHVLMLSAGLEPAQDGHRVTRIVKGY